MSDAVTMFPARDELPHSTSRHLLHGNALSVGPLSQRFLLGVGEP
jgi:hypothetical protein